MEVSWLLLLVSAAVFAAIFLLLVTCVDCKNQGPLAHIIQRTPSEEDVPPTGFVVIHPRSTLPAADVSHAHPSSIALSPYPNSAHSGYRRPTTPTETESNPSYENSGTPPARRESDGEDTGYITVLPENDPGKSRASTPSSEERDCSSSSSSSADDLHEYVNVESQGSSNYLNVPSPSNARSTPEPSCPSVSDDDDDNNYVNQLPINVG